MTSSSVRHAIVVCHPEESSFTLSLARRYSETVEAHGHEAVLRDLYRLGFDPVLRAAERKGRAAADVEREWEALGDPDVYVLVYPIWFGTPPAMLTGYIERVWGSGRVRGQGAGDAGSLLQGKRMVSLTASGSHDHWLLEKGVLSSLRNVHDRYLADVFGFGETHRFNFDGVTTDISAREIRMHLEAAEDAAREIMARMTSGPPDRHPNRRS